MEAFSERFGDLEAVDFIRANTIGVWGEMQNLNELPGREWAPTLCWLGDLHRKSFSHVLLALNFSPGSATISWMRSSHKDPAYAVTVPAAHGGSHRIKKMPIFRASLTASLVGENWHQNFMVRQASCDNSFKVSGEKSFRPMLERVVPTP